MGTFAQLSNFYKWNKLTIFDGQFLIFHLVLKLM